MNEFHSEDGKEHFLPLGELLDSLLILLSSHGANSSRVKKFLQDNEDNEVFQEAAAIYIRHTSKFTTSKKLNGKERKVAKTVIEYGVDAWEVQQILECYDCDAYLTDYARLVHLVIQELFRKNSDEEGTHDQDDEDDDNSYQ